MFNWVKTSNFSAFNTLAMVTKNNQKMIINKSEEVVYTVTDNVQNIGDFSNGFFWVETMEEKVSGNEYTMFLW